MCRAVSVIREHGTQRGPRQQPADYDRQQQRADSGREQQARHGGHRALERRERLGHLHRADNFLGARLMDRLGQQAHVGVARRRPGSVSKMRAVLDDCLAAARRHWQLAADQVRRRGQHGRLRGSAPGRRCPARRTRPASIRAARARRLRAAAELPMLGPTSRRIWSARSISRSSMLLDRLCWSVKYSSALNASSVSASNAPYQSVRRVRSDTPRRSMRFTRGGRIRRRAPSGSVASGRRTRACRADT